MRRLARRHLAACLVSQCLFLPLAADRAGAQEEEDPDNEVIELPPVEVFGRPVTETDAGPVEGYRALTGRSATKTETPLQEIPQSIQVVPRALIDDQNARSAAEALENVSGVEVPERQEGLLSTFFIRGFEADQYIDGSPVFGQTNVVESNTLVNVERIEVIKGPSATLFGGGTGAPLGGLINVVPKSPQFENAYTSGLGGGSFERLTPFWDLNQVLVRDHVAFRFTGDYETAESDIDEIDSERFGLFPSLAVRFTEDTDLLLRGQYTRDEYLEYSGLPAEGAIDGDFEIDRRRFSGASDTPDTVVENGLFLGRLTHRINDGVTAWVQGSYYDSAFEENSSFLFGPAPDPVAAPSEFSVSTGLLETEVTQININPNVSVALDFDRHQHIFLFGAEYDRTENDAFLDFLLGVDTLDYADPSSDFEYVEPDGSFASRQDNVYDTIGVYLQDQVTLFDRLHLLAGVRWTQISVEENALGQQEEDRAVTPRAGAALDLTEEITAFVGYGQGFQAVLNFVGEGAPEPEESEQIEGGFKFAFEDIGLSGSIAGYEILRENVAVPDPADPTRQIQTGEQRARGAELDLVWQPLPEVALIGNYAYTDAEITEDSVFDEGDRLPRIPAHSGRAALRYDVLDGPFEGLGLGFGVTVASGRKIALPNRFETETAVTFDAQLSYRLGPLRAGFSVRNLTDEDYYQPYQFLGQQVVRPGAPRSFFAQASLTF